jgi:F-type H+-transporting ATPase subunit epsilon
MSATLVEVIVLGPDRLLFEGRVSHVIFPGEQGTFEIGPFHRPIVSRLFPGVVTIENNSLPIKRGVVKVERNKVTALVEPA